MKDAILSELLEVSQERRPTRFFFVKYFLKQVLFFPFFLIFRVVRTLFRVVGVVLAVFCVGCSLGSSKGSRELFIERMIAFAKDLAEWVLLPLGLIRGSVRLFLAFLVHPKFY